MKKIINSRPILVFILYIISTGLLAAEEPSAEEARLLLKSTAEDVISYVKQNRAALEADSSKLRALINEKMVPYIDFPRVSRWILGKHWRKATDAQKSLFTNEFKELLIRTYSSALLKVSNEKLIYPPVKGGVENGKVNIKSEFILGDGQRFSVSYRMHHKDTTWKIYDITVDGVSLVSTYRTSFSDEIRKSGLDGMIESLSNKNDELNL